LPHGPVDRRGEHAGRDAPRDAQPGRRRLQRGARDRYLSVGSRPAPEYGEAGILRMVRSDERAFVRPRRFIALGLVMTVLFTALTVRLWDLQVANGAHYRALSEQNRILRIPVEAERGNIIDRNGYVLARNIPGFAIT